MVDPEHPEVRRRQRLLIGKVGLDGHDRGAKIIARALRDAGHEVISTGLHQTPEQVVEIAIQEDVDAVGLSMLSGAHLHLFGRIIELLRERGAGDVTVFGGGIIPEEDLKQLKKMGVRKVFRPGTTTEEILRFLDEECQARSVEP
jgi:methylmalonyl-CoA mutase C-terminal domain/subunit